MKKTILILLSFTIIALTLTSCTTKRYGRLEMVTPKEKEYLSCQAIEVEIEKAQIFIKKVDQEDDKFTKEDVMAFFGDLGIGNHMEVKDAKKSAQIRLDELDELKKQKKCQ